MIIKALSKTLGIYLGKKFLSSVATTTLVLIGFIILIDFIELTRKLSGRPDVANDIVMKMIFLKLPDLIMQVTPFAILIGTLLCFTRLSKDHELIAIRSAGLPARQFLIPPIIVCLGIGLFNLSVLNPFSAATLKSYQHISSEIFPGKTHGFVSEGGKVWLKQQENDGENDYLIHAQSVHARGDHLEDVTIFMFDKQERFKKRVDTENMYLADGKWILERPFILYSKSGRKHNEIGGNTEQLKFMILPTTLTPETIQNSFNSPNTLSVWELGSFIKRLKEAGFPTQLHEMQLQKLLTHPVLILAMFLLGVPFALHFSRDSSTIKMIVSGSVFGFGFYLFTNFVATYGIAGRIDLVLSAWIPTISALFIGMALLLHFREE